MRPSSLIPDNAPELFKPPALAKWLGVTPRCIWKWVACGLLPEPIRVAPKTNYFRCDEVRAALDKRAHRAGDRRQGGRHA